MYICMYVYMYVLILHWNLNFASAHTHTQTDTGEAVEIRAVGSPQRQMHCCIFICIHMYVLYTHM